MPPPSSNSSAPPIPLNKTLALKAAAEFVRAAGQAPPVLLGSGRPFVLDVFSCEWHVVFEEEADISLALMMGRIQPRFRRVAVHSETGACRWVEDE